MNRTVNRFCFATISTDGAHNAFPIWFVSIVKVRLFSLHWTCVVDTNEMPSIFSSLSANMNIHSTENVKDSSFLDILLDRFACILQSMKAHNVLSPLNLFLFEKENKEEFFGSFTLSPSDGCENMELKTRKPNYFWLNKNDKTSTNRMLFVGISVCVNGCA